MTIIKQEVKTIYNISLTTKDIFKVTEDYKEKSHLQIICPKAFENFDIENTTLGNFRHILEHLNSKGNGDTYKLFAQEFGFDGWENAGYYDEHKNKYIMTVYSYGDTIN